MNMCTCAIELIHVSYTHRFLKERKCASKRQKTWKELMCCPISHSFNILRNWRRHPVWYPVLKMMRGFLSLNSLSLCVLTVSCKGQGHMSTSLCFLISWLLSKWGEKRTKATEDQDLSQISNNLGAHLRNGALVMDTCWLFHSKWCNDLEKFRYTKPLDENHTS